MANGELQKGEPPSIEHLRPSTRIADPAQAAMRRKCVDWLAGVLDSEESAKLSANLGQEQAAKLIKTDPSQLTSFWARFIATRGWLSTDIGWNIAHLAECSARISKPA